MSNAESDKPDLSFVTNDELIAELKRRHDAIVVVRELTPNDDKKETYTDYWGGLSYCIGLASRAHDRLLRIANTHDLPPPSDE